MTILATMHETDSIAVTGAGTESTSAGTFNSNYDRASIAMSSTISCSSVEFAAQNSVYFSFYTLGSAGGSINTNAELFTVRNTSGTVIAKAYFTALSTMAIQVMISGTLTTVASGISWTSTNNVLTRVDIEVVGGSSGSINIYRDGSLHSSVSGNWPQLTAITGVASKLYQNSGNSLFSSGIVSSTPILNATSELEPPTSSGTDTGGTGTYTDVDEAIKVDTDVVSLTSGQNESFKGAARTQTRNNVLGVTASARACYEAGDSTQMKPYLKIGGTRYYGNTVTLTLTMAPYQYTWTTNPSTSLPWTVSEANDANLEWGWEAV
jgi:hypothetical protein